MKKKIIIALISLLALTSLILAAFCYFDNPDKILKVNFLDIGQGSAVLIQTPYKQNILIDGGDVDAKILRQLPKFMPFYDRRIDLMILTHPHDDHVGGLVKVLQKYQVQKIVYTGVDYDTPAYQEFLQVSQSRRTPLIVIDRPQNIILGPDLNLDILYPFESLVGRQIENWNNTSIVAKLTYQYNRFLFTGDIENEVETELIAKNIDVASDVMLAAHHGSDTSNTQEFLDLVKPIFAVIQSGVDNEFGHPSLRVLRRLEKLGIIYFRNDLDGWVQFLSDGKKLTYTVEK